MQPLFKELGEILFHPRNGASSYIFVPITNYKIKSVKLFSTLAQVDYKQVNEGVFIYLKNVQQDELDTVFQFEIE